VTSTTTTRDRAAERNTRVVKPTAQPTDVLDALLAAIDEALSAQ
jgi:hypothetical protein